MMNFLSNPRVIMCRLSLHFAFAQGKSSSVNHPFLFLHRKTSKLVTATCSVGDFFEIMY